MRRTSPRVAIEPPPNALTALTGITGVAGILLGIIIGYIIGTRQIQESWAPPPAPAAAAAPAPPPTLVTESDLQGYRDILAKDPKNGTAAETLANKLYDARRYAESIPYYQQALARDPRDVNVSTDLGTAMYYAGRPDDALAQLQASLAIDPRHPQTLFNIGIVKRDGKDDPKGAVEVWERLLTVAPDYPDAARIRTMIAEARRGAM
jgi:tetratricopeptide (TPR) repeat protein